MFQKVTLFQKKLRETFFSLAFCYYLDLKHVNKAHSHSFSHESANGQLHCKQTWEWNLAIRDFGGGGDGGVLSYLFI